MRFAYAAVGADDPYLDGEKLASEIASQLRSSKPSLSILFTTVTDKTKLQGLLNGIKSKLDTKTLIGCTSGGNIIDDRIVDKGSVMLSLYSTRFSAGLAVGTDIKANGAKAAKAAVSIALSSLETLGVPMAKMKRFMLVFMDGLSGAEEDVLEGIRSVVGMHAPVVGGSGGGCRKGEGSYQICQGKIYTDSVVLAFIQTVYNFGFVSHHGWTPTNNMAFVTKAGGRFIEELNNKPAIDVYAKMIGRPVEKLKKDDFTCDEYFRHPLAERDLGGDYWLKYPKDVKGSKLELFSDVAEGTALTLMRFDEATSRAAVDLSLDEISAQINFPGAIIIISSFGRRRLLGAEAISELRKVREGLPGVPIVGLYTLGELGYTKRSISGHQNNTFNMLCVGSGRHERFDTPELMSMLDAFGLDALESKVYTLLLDATPCTVKRLHEITAINYAKLYDVVDHLQHKGIVTVSPFRPKKIYAKELSDALLHLFKETEASYAREREKRLQILNEVSRGKYNALLEQK